MSAQKQLYGAQAAQKAASQRYVSSKAAFSGISVEKQYHSVGGVQNIIISLVVCETYRVNANTSIIGVLKE